MDTSGSVRVGDVSVGILPWDHPIVPHLAHWPPAYQHSELAVSPRVCRSSSFKIALIFNFLFLWNQFLPTRLPHRFFVNSFSFSLDYPLSTEQKCLQRNAELFWSSVYTQICSERKVEEDLPLKMHIFVIFAFCQILSRTSFLFIASLTRFISNVVGNISFSVFLHPQNIFSSNFASLAWLTTSKQTSFAFSFKIIFLLNFSA